MKLVVVKRNLQTEPYQAEKIALAIKKGFDSVHNPSYTSQDIFFIYDQVSQLIHDRTKDSPHIEIETIQDTIEKQLLKYNYTDVYESFSSYRQKRHESRRIFSNQDHQYLKVIESISNLDPRQVTKEMVCQLGFDLSQKATLTRLIDHDIRESISLGEIDLYGLSHYSQGSLFSFDYSLDNFEGNLNDLAWMLQRLDHEVLYQVRLSNWIDYLFRLTLKAFKHTIQQQLENYSFLLEKPLTTRSLIKKISGLKSLTPLPSDFTSQHLSKDVMETIFSLSLSTVLDQLQDALIHFIKDLNKLALRFQVTFFWDADKKNTDHQKICLWLQELDTMSLQHSQSKPKNFCDRQGILSLVSINVRRLYLRHSQDQLIFDQDQFDKDLNNILEKALAALNQRTSYQQDLSSLQLPTLMMDGLYLQSDKLNESDRLKRVLKEPRVLINISNMEDCIDLGKLYDNHAPSSWLDFLQKKVDHLNKHSSFHVQVTDLKLQDVNDRLTAIDQALFWTHPFFQDKNPQNS